MVGGGRKVNAVALPSLLCAHIHLDPSVNCGEPRVPSGIAAPVRVNRRGNEKRGTEFQSQCDYWPF